MAELSTMNPTIVDVQKATAPNGMIAKVVELLHQKNDILDHATWLECNDGDNHQTSVRTGLPTPTWRKLYQFVTPGKSTRANVTDSTGSLHAYAEIDVELASKNGNTEAFRLSEDAAHIEGMNQELASTLIYGNDGTAPAEFTGLAARMNSLSAPNARNIIDAGGNDDDLTSVYLVVWGPNTGHMIYPKGSAAGLQYKDLGEDTATDGVGGLMQVLRSHYSLRCGFVMRDWRYFVRIANIDVSLLEKDPNDASPSVDLIDLMTQALELPPDLSSGRPVFYASRLIRSWLRRQARFAVKNSTLSLEKIGGKPFVMFDEVPVARTDAILHTEDRVV